MEKRVGLSRLMTAFSRPSLVPSAYFSNGVSQPSQETWPWPNKSLSRAGFLIKGSLHVPLSNSPLIHRKIRKQILIASSLAKDSGGWKGKASMLSLRWHTGLELQQKGPGLSLSLITAIPLPSVWQGDKTGSLLCIEHT